MSQTNTESYSAVKGGVNALTHALAVSLQGKARENAIAPGWINVAAISDEMDIEQHLVKRIGHLMILPIWFYICVVIKQVLLQAKHL